MVGGEQFGGQLAGVGFAGRGGGGRCDPPGHGHGRRGVRGRSMRLLREGARRDRRGASAVANRPGCGDLDGDVLVVGMAEAVQPRDDATDR